MDRLRLTRAVLWWSGFLIMLNDEEQWSIHMVKQQLIDSQHHDTCQLLLSHTTTKSAETTAHQQVDLLQDTTSSSTSASTTTYHRLDQLRIALRDPLPPAGMIKHDVDDLEDIEKQYIYHK